MRSFAMWLILLGVGVIMDSVSIGSFTNYPVTGIMVPDSRQTVGRIDTTLSDYTEAGPYEWETIPAAANVRDVNGSEEFQPRIYGSPASSATWTATVTDGGLPDRTGRYTLSDGTNTYYQTPVYVPTAVRSIGFKTAVQTAGHPRMVEMPNGDVGMVWEDWNSGQEIVFAIWDRDTKTWGSSVAVASLPNTFDLIQPVDPEIWSIPSDTASGVVLWVAWLEEVDSQYVQLRRAWSKDNGATWNETGSNLLLDYSGGDEYSNLRIRYDMQGKTLTLVLKYFDGVNSSLWTYRSSDYGATWTRMTAMDIADYTTHDLWTDCGGTIGLLAFDGVNKISSWRCTSLGVTWESLNTDVTDAVDASAHVGATVDASNVVWLMTKSDPGLSFFLVASADGGRTWGSPMQTGADGGFPYTSGSPSMGSYVMGDDNAAPYVSGEDVNGLLYSGGRLFVPTLSRSSSGAIADGQLMVLEFGDRSTITIAEQESPILYWSSYVPTDIPGTRSGSWTDTNAAVMSIPNSNPARLKIAAVGAASYTTQVNSNPSTTALHVRVGFDDSSTASALVPIIRVIANAGGGNEVVGEVYIDFGSTIRAYDGVSAGALGAAAVNIPAGDFEVLADVDGASKKISVYVRALTSSVWTTVVQGATLTTRAFTSYSVSVGVLSAVTATADILWIFPGYGIGVANGVPSTVGEGLLMTSNKPDVIATDTRVRWEP